jgi:23S rRNA pseudouridine2457 synthase
MFEYYLFYKPFQVLTKFSPEAGKKTLADYFTSIGKDVYPVGRLDFDSEGLLLLTNDKELTHKLLEPKFKHKRTYWVQVEGLVTEDSLKQLEEGVSISIDGKPYKTSKAEVTLFLEDPKVPDRYPPIRFRKNIPTSWISLTITEGKNRQVRKMTAAVGYPTLRLIRQSLGDLSVEGMEPGQYRILEKQEITSLFSDK